MVTFIGVAILAVGAAVTSRGTRDERVSVKFAKKAMNGRQQNVSFRSVLIAGLRMGRSIQQGEYEAKVLFSICVRLPTSVLGPPSEDRKNRRTPQRKESDNFVRVGKGCARTETEVIDPSWPENDNEIRGGKFLDLTPSCNQARRPI